MADTLTLTAERVLALLPQDPKRFLLPEQLYLLESLTKQVVALEVERLVGSDVPHLAGRPQKSSLVADERVVNLPNPSLITMPARTDYMNSISSRGICA
jgi:hypothetical protein